MNMENKFEFGAARPKVDVKDDILLGKFLNEKRLLSNKENGNEKLLKQIVSQIGVNISTLLHWETGEVLPSEDKLPLIAQVYGIDLEELKKVFDISHRAREKQKEVGKSLRRKGSSGLKENGIFGEGGSVGKHTKRNTGFIS